MNKTSVFLLASVFFPLIFITACSTQGGDEKKLPVAIILDGTYSSIDEKREVVIKNNEEFNALLNDIYKGMDQKPYNPVVDFTKNSVVAVFIGVRSNGGYMVAIDSITENSNSLTVNITETTAGKNCMVTDATTKPFTIVKIPKTDKKAVFKTKQVVKDCQ